jgi:hypothetical protein
MVHVLGQLVVIGRGYYSILCSGKRGVKRESKNAHCLDREEKLIKRGE